MNSREFQLKFSDFIIAFECSFSACVRSKISLPDPDCLLRNTVSSGTRNWDEFTATLIQAHTDTSFQKSFSEAQVLKWEVLQLSGLGSLKEHGIASAGQLSPLFYCDNCHKSCVIRPPFVAVSRSSAIALVCAHHMRINPMWCVLMTLVTFYTKTYVLPTIWANGVSVKMMVADCAAVFQSITLRIVWFCKVSIEQPSKPC